MDRVPRSERVALVVDDDMFVLSALAELLSEDGFDVHTASNGFSAVRLAMECRPAVILLDLALPERSGTEVLADLRADPATREVAIVVVSGNAHLLTPAQLDATDGVVSKPFDVTELMAAVQRAVRRAALRRAEVAPVAPLSRSPQSVRQRRAAGVRHSRGRR
ncbi:MAG TPA: response regulator [Chloroflexota bacterium]|nr:response regulator [Chloroflexota bacterium]